MTEGDRQDDQEISLFAVATVLLRNRGRIVRWMLFGGIVAGVMAVRRPLVYMASAAFIPQGSDSKEQGLASLAGQLGGMLGSGNQSQSPDFYANLLKSREVLAPLTRDTIVVQEMNGKRVPFANLFEISSASAQRQEERGVQLLKAITTATPGRTTGVVQISVTTKWPSVSLAITRRLVDGVNTFNQQTRQSQAAAERRFLETRLVAARTELRASEDLLETFLKTNRQFTSSPDLTFERDRLQREVVLRQGIVSSLAQAYEDARLREIRDTPVISVLEQPSVSSEPQPRGRLLLGLLGLTIGAIFGTFLVFMSEMVSRRRQQGDAEVRELAAIVAEAKSDILRPNRWFAKRS